MTLFYWSETGAFIRELSCLRVKLRVTSYESRATIMESPQQISRFSTKAPTTQSSLFTTMLVRWIFRRSNIGGASTRFEGTRIFADVMKNTNNDWNEPGLYTEEENIPSTSAFNKNQKFTLQDDMKKLSDFFANSCSSSESTSWPCARKWPHFVDKQALQTLRRFQGLQ